MDIEYAVGKRAYKLGRKQPHVTRKTYQINIRLLERRDDFRIVIFTNTAFGWYQLGLKAALPGQIQSLRIRTIGDDGGDLSLQTSCLNRIGDSLEIRAAPGEQNAKFFERSHAQA
jgi:hypothetical protein